VKKFKHISYGKQNIIPSDIKAVSSSLKNKDLTNGLVIKKLELKLKKYFSVRDAIVCSSGTAAIHLALLSIDLKKNDTVIMPAINFISSYNICKLMGARIILADVDQFTGQITPLSVLKILKEKKLKKIKAIITMYMGGFPENVKEFFELKKKLNCYIIEDSCHALGAEMKYSSKKYKIGSCKFSDISTFSMHPVKTITSGEGGIITTNKKILTNKIRLLRSHGLYRSHQSYWKYYSKYEGLNYRLSEINCALALNQLSRINKFIRIRSKIFKKYKKELLKYDDYIQFPKYKNNIGSSYHLNIVHLNFTKLKGNKDNFIKFLNKYNIYPQYHYMPIYRLKNMKKIRLQNYSGSEKYFDSAISLPIYVNLNNKMLSFVIKKIINYLEKFKKSNVQK
jgi:UDP-4-amino-4,6-dideoxy-L-N-acetyl-beta-L-altrosamine transaminase